MLTIAHVVVFIHTFKADNLPATMTQIFFRVCVFATRKTFSHFIPFSACLPTFALVVWGKALTSA
jgi:hypothetical protein